jgi:hypothetical protein
MIFILFILFAAFAASVTAAVAAAIVVSVAPMARNKQLLPLPYSYRVVLLNELRRNAVSSIFEDIVDCEDVDAPPVRTRKDKYGEDIHAPPSWKRTMESRNKEGRSRIYKKDKKKRVRPPHKCW